MVRATQQVVSHSRQNYHGSQIALAHQNINSVTVPSRTCQTPCMHPIRTTKRHFLSLASIALALTACGDSLPNREPIAPIIAGLGDQVLLARDRGMVLLGELNCVGCHQATGGIAVLARSGPKLAAIGNRVRPDFLRHFLTDPHATDPGTTMPAMLFDRSASAREAAVSALSNYLRSFAIDAPSVIEPHDADAAARGKTLFHEVGCVACHAPRDEQGNERPLPDSLPLGNLSAKYRPAALRAFLLAPQDVRPDARMPDLHLTPTEAHELTSYLLASKASAEPPPPAINATEVALGRTLFAERNCASCHALPDPTRPAPRTEKPLRELANHDAGCLSLSHGKWPAFELTAEQRSDILAALRNLDAPFTDEQLIHQSLAQSNCTACHQRGESGGVTPAHSKYFTTNDQNIGQESKIPPPLTLVGAKLQRDWLQDAIANGQLVRPYLRTRMPGFGPSIATTLTELLARTDTLKPMTLPTPPDGDKQQEQIRNLGCELVGDKGMNCITCHAFAGERVGTMAAVDLIDGTGQRLRREWFHHFMRAPFDFRPGTLMPQFFVNGTSSRPNLGGGDVMQQIDAMWQYLAEGRNTRQPSGLRHPAIELQADKTTVLLRRSTQRTGKRGINVGFPNGASLTFDAESLAMNQIWWGKFVDASGVWYGQGSGEVHPMSQQLAQLPKGPAFASLSDNDAPWPTATRRELGDQWLGYDLDAQQRPSFRYACSAVTITDAPIALAAEQGAKPTVRRTLTFASVKDFLLSFRAARDPSISDLGNGEIAVGKALRITLPPGTFRIRQVEQDRELIVTIPISQGHAELIVGYRWQEEGK